jgi:hypothetical protein
MYNLAINSVAHLFLFLMSEQNNGFKRTQIALFLMILVLGGVMLPHLSYAQQSEKSTPIDKIKERFESGQLFTASFEHTLVDSFTEDTTVQTGKIWVAEKAYKVQTNSQILVVDGTVSKAFDRYKNRLIISKYDPQDDDFAPSKILNGMDSTYTVSRNVVDGKYRIVQMGSDDPFATFTFVEVVTTKTYQPISITAIDQTDNEYKTRFYQGKFVEFDQQVFVLDLPESVETVDLRKQ